jgi:lipid-A-disaccharide synthase-like uncharacterized protein
LPHSLQQVERSGPRRSTGTRLPRGRLRTFGREERRSSNRPAVFEILGSVGVAISVAAYVPQVVHLGREHCSAGISSRAWVMWLASSLLIGALALHRRDAVFISLQAINLLSISVTLFLARRYRGMVCEFHARQAVSAVAAPTAVNDPSAESTISTVGVQEHPWSGA